MWKSMGHRFEARELTGRLICYQFFFFFFFFLGGGLRYPATKE